MREREDFWDSGWQGDVLGEMLEVEGGQGGPPVATEMGGARNRQALCSATEPDEKDKFHYSCIYI